MGLRIANIALAVPPLVETAADLAPRMSKTAEWIEKNTGVLRRRVASPDLQTPDLAAEAARFALGQNDPPDLILYASASPHQLLPDTSVFLQRALGLSGVAGYSIHASCLSFLVALQTADALLAAGAYRRILICSAELASRARNWQEPESASLLGDGAAAAVVEWEESDCGLREFVLQTWPEGAELTEVRGVGLRKHPNDPDTRPEDQLFHMDGQAAYRMTRPRAKKMIEGVLRKANLTLDQIDLVIPHQASGPGLRLLEKLGIAPQKIVNIIADYGNCVAASIPMALAEAVRRNRIQPGDRLLLLGSAAGLSLGAAVLQW